MEALRTYLKRHGLSQGEFAETIGTTSGVVCRWLSGKRTPRIDWILKIDRATCHAVPASSWATLSGRHAA